jgi:hypothetical protein
MHGRKWNRTEDCMEKDGTGQRLDKDRTEEKA